MQIPDVNYARSGEVTGIAVPVGARVVNKAASGEVLVSDTEWRLYAVRGT